MDYQLVVVRGRSGAQALQLADGITTVGRHDDCQLRIKSSQVSRKHCELFEKKGMLLVKDLGSANGTFVNGEKVDGQRVLEPGDELTIGQVTLRVEKKGAEAIVTLPAAKPSDTALGAPATSAGAESVPDDDGFDLNFDTEFEPDPVVPDGSDLDELLESPVPATSPSRPPATTPSAKSSPDPAPGAEKEPADDAVADFLLDIKFDEDE